MLRLVKGRKCSWLSHELKVLMDSRDKLLKKARKTKKECDWSAYKTMKNRCNNKIKQAKQKHYKELLLENSQNPSKFWNCIKELFPKTTTPITATTSNDPSKNLEKANSLCNFFSNVAHSLKSKAFKLRDFKWEMPKVQTSNFHSFHFAYVSRIFVERELKKLQRRKAAGIDNIPPGLLKDAAHPVSGPLTHIVNLSLSTGIVPSEWKVAKVTAIHKGGSTSDQNNFRPISVLPICSKILERAVHNQLSNYLESNNLLSKRQFGYRKQRSTELATLLFVDDIRKAVDQGLVVGALYVDLSKAFDTLSHSVLLEKIRSFGLNGVALEWFIDYLFNRKQYCIIDKSASDQMSITCGVPQGSILGPLLFLMYFNDFEMCIRNAKCLNFADDTVIYVQGKTKEIVEDLLNEDLKRISSYLASNQLIINLKKGKTECMIFGTAKRLSKCDKVLRLFYNDTRIETTESYKYLGTTLDSSLSLSKNFDVVYKKSIAKLRTLYSLRNYFGHAASIKVFKGMILPCITFNSSINLNLTTTQKQKLSRIDRMTTKVTGEPQIRIETEIRNHSVMLVRKCMEQQVCDSFHSYFEMISHTMNTRNNQYSLRLPKVKLNYAKNAFYFMGATIYNKLPLRIRQIENINLFKKSLKNLQ